MRTTLLPFRQDISWKQRNNCMVCLVVIWVKFLNIQLSSLFRQVLNGRFSCKFLKVGRTQISITFHRSCCRMLFNCKELISNHRVLQQQHHPNQKIIDIHMKCHREHMSRFIFVEPGRVIKRRRASEKENILQFCTKFQLCMQVIQTHILQ